MEKINPINGVFKSLEDLERVAGKRQRVYYEVLGIEPDDTRVRLITYGKNEKRVDEEFDKWQQRNPDKIFGTFMTGPMLRREKEEYLAIMEHIINRLDVTLVLFVRSC